MSSKSSAVATGRQPEPELHLHKDWLKALDRAKIKYTAWGSAGPDILVAHSSAILEVKKAETATLVREGYEEIFDRTDSRFKPANAPFVGVITPEKVRVWRNTEKGYGPLEAPDLVFLPHEQDQVLALLKHKELGFRLNLDDHIDSVLRLIYGKHCPDSVAALMAVLNLHKRPVLVTNKAIFFAPGTAEERAIDVSPAARDFIVSELTNKYQVQDPELVKYHIRHRWSQYQADGRKAGLGKYYTPEHLVTSVRELLGPVLREEPDAYVADLAAGCGAFLAAFEDYRILGRDIDDQAVLVLKEMGFGNIAVDNSLKEVSREKIGLHEDDTLVLVGNPPYNDTTSLNKRYSTDKKEALAVAVDADIRSKDLGISFLRAFAKLRPKAICVLHPLSYLTKEANFRALKEFSQQYKLTAGFVFSSAEFGANIGAKTPFAVVAALYEPGEMAYADIQAFRFPIFKEVAGSFRDSGERLVLNHVRTIDGLIRKYPPTKGMPTVSDIGLYNYNIRDTNSLITSGAITANTDDNRIPVQFDELWKYAYLNCIKRYFGYDFVFGNLSPVCREADFDKPWFRDACVLDTIMNHPNLAPTKRGSADSFVVTKFVLSDAKRRAKAFIECDVPNFYQAFVEYWERGADTQRVMKPWFEQYFSNLRECSLTGLEGGAL